MSFTTPEQDAIARLAQYNGNPYDAATNAYGLSGDGYRADPVTGFAGNWANTTTDQATVANGMARIADDAATSAAAAASSATDAANVAVNGLTTTSSTSFLIGTGSKAFTTADNVLTTKPFKVGQFVQIASRANTTNYMVGTVTAVATNTLTVNVTQTGGSGTLTDWNILATGAPGPSGGVAASQIISKAFSLPVGANVTYTLDAKAAFAYALTGILGGKTSAGTITASIYNGATLVYTSNLTTTAADNTSNLASTNVFAGDRLTLVLSSNSGATGVELTLRANRTLA